MKLWRVPVFLFSVTHQVVARLFGSVAAQRFRCRGSNKHWLEWHYGDGEYCRWCKLAREHRWTRVVIPYTWADRYGEIDNYGRPV